ncbi:MAG: CBS domain-containing protein [Candidatus Odinarchaeota archaeon]|nr:CBS domain-containing protein [Candidatus Odinarchaeota archaeon]
MYLPTPKDIKKMRLKAGLTQAELAKMAGVSQSLIARIESGSVDPRLSTLKKIIGVLTSTAMAEYTISEILKMKNKEFELPKLVFVKPKDKVEKAIHLMKKFDISQLPVLDDTLKPVGSITERNLMMALSLYGKDLLTMDVEKVMEESFPIVGIDSKLSEVYSLFLGGNDAVLVTEKGRVVGILTKIDILTYLIQ